MKISSMWSLFRPFLYGAASGVAASVGLTLVRWLTAAPYSPLMIPFDVGLFVIVLGLNFAVIWHLTSKSAKSDILAPSAALPVLGFYGSMWVLALSGTGGGAILKVINALILFLAVQLFVFHTARQRRSRLGLGYFCLLIGVAFTISVKGYVYWKGFSVLLPLAILLSIAPGIPTPDTTFRSVRGPVFLAALLSVLCAGSVYPGSAQLAPLPAAGPKESGPSVVLIVLDTLRRDRVSLYGYDRKTTPELDAWSKDAMVFNDAISASSWTLPGHASMFTGLYPISHGAHGSQDVARSVLDAYPLPDAKITIAELARKQQIVTGGIAANWAYLSPRLRLNQGFMTYWAARPNTGDDPSVLQSFNLSDRLARFFCPERYRQFNWPYYRDAYITDNAIRWLRAAKGQRFFLFVNYFDVHAPNYRAPNAVISGENERALDPNKSSTDVLVELQQQPFADDVENYVVNNYDRELLHLDRELGRLLRFIANSDLDDNTTVIITSDHGSYFGEHRLLGHSLHLHEPVVNVPLVVKGPGIEPGTSSKRVHSIDVFHTILELLQLPDDGHEGMGHSIFSEPESEMVTEWYPTLGRPVKDPRLHGRFDRILRAIRVGDLKLFASERGDDQLFDLARDPGELKDISAESPEETAKLRSRLEAWLEAVPKWTHGTEGGGSRPNRSSLTEEEIRRLRSLGYAE